MTLNNIDPEDFGDALAQLEKSFGVKFCYSAFAYAKTFGDICDIIQSQIDFTHIDDCTSQQAFYKIRNSICATQNIDKQNITAKSKFDDIFPRFNRRQQIKKFQSKLGIRLNIIVVKRWIGWTTVIGFVISLIAFFFNWEIALLGLTFFSLFGWITGKFANEFDISTVEELTKEIVKDHYSKVRRNGASVNKNEITQTIQQLFIDDWGIEKSDLTRQASLRWT